MNTPAPAPSLIRAAPRDPAYIQVMMHKQPNAEPIINAMEACAGNACLADRPPGNIMGDLGDLAEFIYTCDMGFDPCVPGGGGGGGGTAPGELQGSGSTAFGSKPVGSTSAPLTLTLSNVGSTTVNISGVSNSNTADFTITANGCTALSQTASCGITVTFHPSASGTRSATVTVTSDGVGSPQNFTFTGNGTLGGAANYGGLWWNPSESGWGINFEHQGNLIFATWFTYDDAGKSWWLVMTAAAGAGNSFTGALYKTTGSPYSAATFVGGDPVSVGTGTLTFADGGHATFDSIVNGKAQQKSITPQAFGPLPTCTYSTTADLAAATNYQGLWWNASESGWGINFAHQGNTIFATWFTFDVDGTPMWLVSIMSKGADGTFSGRLLRETATPFAATPFVVNPPVDVGSATLTFTNGNNASFKYTIGPVSKTKALTRQALAPGGTVCN
jgi:HYDIN/CFA65/VesB family protein